MDLLFDRDKGGSLLGLPLTTWGSWSCDFSNSFSLCDATTADGETDPSGIGLNNGGKEGMDGREPLRTPRGVRSTLALEVCRRALALVFARMTFLRAPWKMNEFGLFPLSKQIVLKIKNWELYYYFIMFIYICMYIVLCTIYVWTQGKQWC